MRPQEVLQEAGQTIFVPCGWWHCVLNLEVTVAVTQNFVSPANLEAVMAFESLGAGALVDPNFLPAFLDLQEERRAGAGEGGAGAGAAPGAAVAPPEAVAGPGQEKRSGAQQRHVMLGGTAAQQRAAGELAGDRQRGSSVEQSTGVDISESGDGPGSDSDSDVASVGPLALRVHLRRLPFGFGASHSGLCPWLRLLWQEQPDLQPQVLALALKYTDLRDWEVLLAQACAAAGRPAPQQHEGFPLAGGDCVVFEVRGGPQHTCAAGGAPATGCSSTPGGHFL